MSTKKALVIVAPMSEEMETVIAVDVLRRAKIDVTLAGLDGSDSVKCSRSVVLVPDDSLTNAAKAGLFDAVVLPGGLIGSPAFSKSAEVGQVLKAHDAAGKVLAAICAAPVAFKTHEIAVGKRLTSHPLTRDEFKDTSYTYSEERVVQDGHIITSRSPGTAFEWALAIVGALLGPEKEKELHDWMICK